MATIEDFSKYKLKIDFRKEIGIKKSCAQLVRNYTKEQLKGKLILAVINFPSRQIGQALSEVLTLGVPGESGDCVLIEPEREVDLGVRLY